MTPDLSIGVGTYLAADGSTIVVDHLGLHYIPAPATPAPTPVPVPTQPPIPAPGRQLSVYLKMWANRSQPGLAAAAVPGITEVRLAFLQGAGKLVGWGSQDVTGVRRDADALRARGVRVTASIGGESGAVNTSDRAGWLAGVAALHATIGLDRIDWDVEASALRADDVLWLSQTVHDRYGILSTMAPNGSNVGTYLPVAVELYRRGLLAAYGQQFYGSAGGVTLAAARGRIAEAVRAGIPARVIQVGMWVGSEPRQWPMSTCENNLRAIAVEWRDIGGAYLWSETHVEVAEWARRMAAVLP